MAVKGPRLHRMVVIAERPGKRLTIALMVIALCAGIAAVAFVAGRVLTLRELAGDGEDAGTVASLERLVEQNASLRDELSVYRGGGDVSRQVEEKVRTDNHALQERVSELEQALADYRRILVPDRTGKGLHIERLDLAASGTPGVWLLRMVLMRVGDTDGAVEGELDGHLVIDGPTGHATVPLSQLAATDKRQFRVRYVEERMIELHLPAGAVPSRMDLVATLSAPRADHVEKSWLRQQAAKASPASPAVKPQEVPGDAGQG